MFRTIHCLALCLMAAIPARAQSPRLDRLERLATHLETKVRPGSFDINSWGNGDDPDALGYVGCAAGHSVAIFRADGLKLDPGYAGSAELAYGNLKNAGATKAFFGVNDAEYRTLFTTFGGAAHDPKKAAANIRKVVTVRRVRESLTRAAIPRLMLAAFP